jgi:hypothetical protein
VSEADAAIGCWTKGPPPGRGRYWVVWALRSGVKVEAVELSPALIYYADPNARLLIKTMWGAAYEFEANKADISHHMPLDPPEAP